MKIFKNASFLFTGWVAGVIAALGFGLLWPVMFPAIIQFRTYSNAGSGLFLILGIVLILVSPTALIGGLVGSRLPKEGGRTSQFIMAALFGVILALPVACLALGFITPP
jgi:drug/metabolite transporter (DMT)-like permease